MPNQYYTVHEGIRGTGKPLVAKASEAVEEGSEKRTSETGGTYRGLLLSESAMQSMKEAAGDFYIFTPDQTRDSSGQVQYTVQATLPTKVGNFSNPMETFNLLEQNNRLVKGMASMFYNAEGKLDTDKADKFMAELAVRTDIDLYGVLNPDDVTMGNKAAKEANKTWICEQFHIPEEERPEFKTFLDTAFYEKQEHRIYKGSNFHQLWRSFSNKLSGVDELLKSDALTPDMKVKIEAGKKNAIKELEEMAGMNPKTSQKAYVPTECNGSSNSMMVITQMNNLGKGQPAEGLKFHVNINNEESKKIQNIVYG